MSHYSLKSTNTKYEVKFINQIVNLYTRKLRIRAQQKNVESYSAYINSETMDFWGHNDDEYKRLV